MKHTSKKWCKKLGIRLSCIFDPDGWDRTDFDYSFYKEKIIKEEFIEKLGQSTVRFSPAITKVFSEEI